MRRSTRNKMRWQLEKIQVKILSCLEHLDYLETLAQGQSQVVNEHLPQHKELLRKVHSVFIDFRDNL